VAGGFFVDRLIERGYADESDLDDDAGIMLSVARLFIRGSKIETAKLLARVLDSSVGKLLCNIDRRSDVLACICHEGFSADQLSRMRRTLLVVDAGKFPMIRPFFDP
jgi:hypothetical protein